MKHKPTTKSKSREHLLLGKVPTGVEIRNSVDAILRSQPKNPADEIAGYFIRERNKLIKVIERI